MTSRNKQVTATIFIAVTECMALATHFDSLFMLDWLEIGIVVFLTVPPLLFVLWLIWSEPTSYKLRRK